MTIIDLDDLCGDCPSPGTDACLGCLRMVLHDMVHGNDYSIVPDRYEGKVLVLDDN